MARLLALLVFGLVLSACQKCAPTPPPPEVAPIATPEVKVDLARQLQDAEAASYQRRADAQKCINPVSIYEGSITVDASDYTNPIERGADFVDEPIEGLERTVSSAKQLRFTLDYPFEKPFNGTVAGKLTLRNLIDAIRAGFRQMYKGANVSDIPGMMNKDVKGPYGSSFHAIGDLVIESIDLCDGDRIEIGIGS